MCGHESCMSDASAELHISSLDLWLKVCYNYQYKVIQGQEGFIKPRTQCKYAYYNFKLLVQQ